MADIKKKKNFGLRFWQLKSFIPRIVLYFLFTSLTSSGIESWPDWVVLVVKILPIAYLIKFVWLQHGSLGALWRCPFSRYVTMGLFFSLLGDSLLVYQNYDETLFIAGIICFALGHTFYICAFGWETLQLPLLVKFMCLSGSLYWYLWRGDLANQSVSLKVGVAVYAILIGCMNWRAWARLSYQDFVDGRWYEFMGCIGAFCFMVSDSALAINKFRGPYGHENLIIMGTYYVAQLGIALSVVDGPDLYRPKKLE